MMRVQMKADTVYIMPGVRKVADKARVAAAWRRVLEWPGENLIGYHDPPRGVFTGDVRAALTAAVRRVKQLA